MITLEKVTLKRSGFLIDFMPHKICVGETILACGTMTQRNVRITWQITRSHQLLENPISMFSAIVSKVNLTVTNLALLT